MRILRIFDVGKGRSSLNTLHFKYAVEVERTGSITQAAENLYMGQPNLSKAIMELEDTLGFQIFERTSKGVLPTEKGTRFLSYAKNILSQIEKMEALSDENTTCESLGLVISRSGYIASAAAKFAAEMDPSGKIRLNVRETNSVQVISSVAAGSFGLGVVRYKLLHERYFLDYISDKELGVIPFWEFDSMVTASKRNCALGEEFGYQRIGEMTPVVYGDESIPYLSFGEVRREAKSPAADRAIFVYDRSTALEFLHLLPDAYMLTSPAPFSELEKYGLMQKKCDIPNERCKDIIVFQKGYKFTDADKKFIDLLSEIKNEAELMLR